MLVCDGLRGKHIIILCTETNRNVYKNYPLVRLVYAERHKIVYTTTPSSSTVVRVAPRSYKTVFGTELCRNKTRVTRKRTASTFSVYRAETIRRDRVFVYVRVYYRVLGNPFNGIAE